MNVVVQVKGAKTILSISSGAAVYRFASGDVSVPFARPAKSKALTVRARTIVPAEEAAGPVVIDATVVLDGVVYTFQATGTVEAAAP